MELHNQPPGKRSESRRPGALRGGFGHAAQFDMKSNTPRGVLAALLRAPVHGRIATEYPSSSQPVSSNRHQVHRLRMTDWGRQPGRVVVTALTCPTPTHCPF